MPFFDLLRVAVLVLSMWVLSWSWHGAAGLLRRQFTRAHYTTAGWFWFAVTTILFQVAHWMGVTPEWRATLLAGMLVALILASAGRDRG